MRGWDDVRALAMAMPQATERESRGMLQWRISEKLFVWERPLRRSDLDELGVAAPRGLILGARVEHEIAKQALIADDPSVFFTTAHFNGYPAILVALERISPADLREVVTEAWLARAPPKLAATWLAERS